MDGLLRITRFLIHDRDPLFSASFRATLSPAGVETVKLPARSPNLNAHAERFVRSIKHECLNRIVPLGENHLRTAVRAYVAHYHLERNHQGLDNKLICEVPDSPCTEGDGSIRVGNVLAGLSDSCGSSVSGAAAFSRPKIEGFQKRDGGWGPVADLPRRKNRNVVHGSRQRPFSPSFERSRALIMIDLACGPSFGTLRGSGAQEA